MGIMSILLVFSGLVIGLLGRGWAGAWRLAMLGLMTGLLRESAGRSRRNGSARKIMSVRVPSGTRRIPPAIYCGVLRIKRKSRDILTVLQA